MAAMKRALTVLALLVLAAFSIWLMFHEQAASPGPLTEAHADNTACIDCHTPIRGVDSQSCLECHTFDDYYSLRPAIRFHLAGRHCTTCHTEHRGANGNISRMDHTLLHADLSCSDCHLDPHQGLFGRQCRQCHGMTTWNVPGYHHPSIERGNCIRCHRPPFSHADEDTFERLRERHTSRTGAGKQVRMQDCWECHVTHDWRHLRM
jgi:hypothetical protein